MKPQGLSVEELLKPRYKVIADYPKSIYPVGTVIDAGWRSGDLIYCDHDGPRMSQYPHLFKLLQWWEERKDDELPDYIKRDSGVVVKLDKPYAKLSKEHKIAYLFDRDERGIKNYIHLKSTTPATETEYNDYLKTKKP